MNERYDIYSNPLMPINTYDGRECLDLTYIDEKALLYVPVCIPTSTQDAVIMLECWSYLLSTASLVFSMLDIAF